MNDHDHDSPYSEGFYVKLWYAHQIWLVIFDVWSLENKFTEQ